MKPDKINCSTAGVHVRALSLSLTHSHSHTHTHTTHSDCCKMEVKVDFSETWGNAYLEDHKIRKDDIWTSISFEAFLNLERKTHFLITRK